jgi:peptidoglycan/xylan/chitin deacetylase (PgdA/CDA1 family)
MVLGTEAPHFALRRRTFVVVVSALAIVAAFVAAMPSGATVQRRSPAALGTGASGRRRASVNARSTDSAPPTSTAPTPPSTVPTPATQELSGGPSAEVRRLIDLGQPIFCGGTQKPLVALTFDDGPGVLSPNAVAQLRTHHQQTTFFLVGKLLAQGWLRPDLEKEIRFGATFGDHTWDHVSVAPGSAQIYSAQIARTRDLEQQLTGRNVYLFRPPYGSHDEALARYLRSQGMLDVLWSIDSRDSQGANANQIYRNVKKSIGPGSIVLMHDNRGTTENALPRILDLLDKLGLRSVSVPQLLTQDPPSLEQVRRHTCG